MYAGAHASCLACLSATPECVCTQVAYMEYFPHARVCTFIKCVFHFTSLALHALRDSHPTALNIMVDVITCRDAMRAVCAVVLMLVCIVWAFIGRPGAIVNCVCTNKNSSHAHCTWSTLARKSNNEKAHANLAAHLMRAVVLLVCGVYRISSVTFVYM